MSRIAQVLWTDLLRPLLRRPPYRQVAALCWREGERGREILLITSRGTGRWILPKGWPSNTVEGPEMALREAWEEAGVRRARVDETPVGRYRAEKHRDGGLVLPCEVDVYAAEMLDMRDDYPESGQRRRLWCRPVDAAAMVDEPGLSEILKRF